MFPKAFFLSKQDFRKLSLIFTGNHQNWVFYKNFLFPFATIKLIEPSAHEAIVIVSHDMK